MKIFNIITGLNNGGAESILYRLCIHDINYKHIDFICDTTPEKIGKFSPGMHIPIKPMNYFHEDSDLR